MGIRHCRRENTRQQQASSHILVSAMNDGAPGVTTTTNYPLGPGIRHNCGDGKDGEDDGEARLGKGGTPGTCGKNFGDGKMTLAWLLLGVKGIEPPAEASMVKYLHTPLFSPRYTCESPPPPSPSFSSSLALEKPSCTLILSSLKDLAREKIGSTAKSYFKSLTH